ncbi:MAG TPA: DNA cytosine methyltransferase, partial [Fibrobacteria bacterium]|nr:DNA cytosine methyltransferase [Fibrobacteria bacterium]
MNLIDLFSGCGGMSFGFESVGFQTLLGIDN